MKWEGGVGKREWREKCAEFENEICHVYGGFNSEAAETEGRRRMISKSFHHQLKYHNKQPLVGKGSVHMLVTCI